ncbi:MAG: ParB/RepB/Spo0J family partition protein, partial [Patescibacteria group bacterium]
MDNNGLGRGLSSLIPQKIKKSEAKDNDDLAIVDVTAEDDKDKVLRIRPDDIKVNPQQPRQNFNNINMDELVDSIKEYGIIQPLIVTRKNGEYELIAGERRLRAAKELSLKEVPVIIRAAEDQEKLEVALIENLQRENLNPIETAMAYRKLIDDFNLTHEGV